MTDAIQGRQLVLRWDRDRDPLELRRREWLVTNGLGGYASGTIAGIPTRKYHGLFVPNLAGLGYTLNFGRPAAFVVLAVLLLPSAVMLVVMAKLH